MGKIKTVIKIVIILLISLQLQAQQLNPSIAPSLSKRTHTQTTDRIIIKYKDNKILNNSNLPSLVQSIQQAGRPLIKMNMIRQNMFHANVVKVNVKQGRPTLAEIKSLAVELSNRTDIEYAEPDYMAHIAQVPDDTYYALKQWHYKNTAGGANLEGAWDITTGSASDVIAVIDTGILAHEELAAKTLQGYDFISDSTIANDGDGRDADASDTGDWCYYGDACYDGSKNRNSTWHGTHVAGTIAAQSNNGTGVTGINWQAKILPIRVLGKGGGYSSDIVDGMLWAAGFPVLGITDNLNPAKVLNLSLGGEGNCSITYQNAIDAINAAGSIIVIAAGNDNHDAANNSPGNCNGVITVAASSEDGSRAYYSNFGSTVEITAPGGNYQIDSMIYSTLDSGATLPQNDNTYAAYQGTSMAAPHITGIASLISSASVLPDADYAQVLNILQQTARSFPVGTGNDCTTAICGAGIVDAAAALALAFDYQPSLCLPDYIYKNSFEDILSQDLYTTGFNYNHWKDGGSGQGTDNLYHSTFAKTGSYHLFGESIPWISGSYVAITLDALPENTKLKFSHFVNLEQRYDGGVIEYSIDDGIRWQDAGDLITSGQFYSYTISTLFENPLAGRSAFSGTTAGYVDTEIDLSILANQNVIFRWYVGTDSSVSVDGWYIDDVAVFTCSKNKASNVPAISLLLIL